MEESKQHIILSADEIMNGKVVLDKELVPLSGGRAVYVREMTGTEKNHWENASMKKTVPIGNKQADMQVNLEDYYSRIMVFTVCDADGNRLFNNDWLFPKKLKEIGDKFKSSDVEAIVLTAHRINKITPEDQKVLMGNSEADQKEDSDSGSVQN